MEKLKSYHAEFKGKLGAPVVIRAPKTLEQLGAAMDAITSEFRASVNTSCPRVVIGMFEALDTEPLDVTLPEPVDNVEFEECLKHSTLESHRHELRKLAEDQRGNDLLDIQEAFSDSYCGECPDIPSGDCKGLSATCPSYCYYMQSASSPIWNLPVQ